MRVQIRAVVHAASVSMELITERVSESQQRLKIVSPHETELGIALSEGVEFEELGDSFLRLQQDTQTPMLDRSERLRVRQ